MHWSIIVHYFVSLLAITNPIGAVAIFISLSSHHSRIEQRQIANVTALVTCVILLIVTWVGDMILDLLSISVSSFQMAGGIIIMMLGLSMLQAKKTTILQKESITIKDNSIAIVPMAIPIIAGPGAWTTIIVYGQQYPRFLTKIPFSICDLLIAAIIWLILYFATNISKLLGVTGIKIATSIMGLILVAMAMEVLSAGILAAFPGLST